MGHQDRQTWIPDSEATLPPSDAPNYKKECSTGHIKNVRLPSPVHVKAKICMQELWKNKLEWDEPLNDDLLNQWKDISDNLNKATQTTTKRQYFDSDNMENAELFAYSSNKAYGCVAYLKHNGETSIVIAKTRVAPLKAITLPRLELMAARSYCCKPSRVYYESSEQCQTFKTNHIVRQSDCDQLD